MKILIICWLILNSWLFAMATVTDLHADFKGATKDWLIVMIFGPLLFIYNSVPKWRWFDDNVTFWFGLWFTDKWKDIDPMALDQIRDWFGKTRQFKAIL